MKKIVLIICLLLCSVMHSKSQINQFDMLASKHNIVRSLDDGRYLIYAEDLGVLPEQPCFLLYDENADPTIALAFKLNCYPDIHVQDFRIMDGWAYFCGTVKPTPSLGNAALIGSFDIQGVFDGLDNVLVGYIIDNTSKRLVARNMRRLDLFKVGTTVCMAMVGDAEYYGSDITTVMSAFWNGSSWVSYGMVHKGDAGFTDIVCLDDLVVAAGTVYADTGCLVKTFWPTLDFPAQGCFPLYTHKFTHGHPVGNILITKDEHDIAVMAHFDDLSGMKTVFQRTAFDVTTGAPLPPVELLETMPYPLYTYSTPWEMLELTDIDGFIYLLQKAAYPSAPLLGVCDWRVLACGITSSVLECWSSTIGEQVSLDVVRAERTTYSQDYLMLHGPVWPGYNDDCQTHIWSDTYKTSAAVDLEDFAPIGVWMNTSHRIFNPFIYEVTVGLQCYSETKK